MTHAIPIPLRSTTSCLPLLVARCNDSINTCTKDAIIATEKMSYGLALSTIMCGRHIPLQEAQIVFCRLDTARQLRHRYYIRGRRPTICLSVCTPIAQLVPRMMNVLSKSRAESTSEAVRDIEAEYSTATALAATRMILTMVLTKISACRSCHSSMSLLFKASLAILSRLASRWSISSDNNLVPSPISCSSSFKFVIPLSSPSI
jgi:hypothetical protein